jgi:16S rRNA (adenine1518-N6/adenine1519-N6)-dimethyltransferase
VRAKKSYGQHFLNNEAIAERIAASLKHRDQYQKVLEVGPGKAMLTKYLLKEDYDLVVVEADRDMVSYLQKNYPTLKDYIIPQDFLKLNLEDFFGNNSFAIIGNFPYNISSQILFKMLDYKSQVPELVGMFQKEVAERVVALPGSKTYGVTSVLIQAFYHGEYLFDVGPRNFSPPPKVQSAVIRLVRKKDYTLDCNLKLFRRVVKSAFSQRRKMLRNTMKQIIPKDHPFLDTTLFKQRPEQLSVSEFIQLTNDVEEILTKVES